MKIKKSAVPSAGAASGGAVIADRFRLDADPKAAKAAAEKGVLPALIAVVINIALLAAVAIMMWGNWTAVDGH